MQRLRVGETLLHVGDKRSGVTASPRQRKNCVYSRVSGPLPWEHGSEGSERKPLAVEKLRVNRVKTTSAFLNNLRHYYIEECALQCHFWFIPCSSDLLMVSVMPLPILIFRSVAEVKCKMF